MSSILSFVVILSILILVHELGHFLVARKLGIKVEEFGLGYPPKMLSRMYKGVEYSLNWFPFGGFVRMLGEDSAGQVENKEEIKQAFFTQTKKIRVAVLLAGVVMNFLLGVVLFGAVYTKMGIPEQVDYLVVTGVGEDSPAGKAGMEPGDKIVAVSPDFIWSEPDVLVEKFVKYTADHKGEEISLTLESGEEVKVVLRSEEEIQANQGALGVVISNVDQVLYPYWQRPVRGIWVGMKEAVAWGKEIAVSLGSMFAGLFQGDVPKDVAGPIGIYQISKDVANEGFLATLQFMAILSINLSILNLLPIPALDGGRLFFIFIEAVTRKRVNHKVEQAFHAVGMIFLLGLMVAVTVGDVRRLMG